MESYIVRIYRSEKKEPQKLVGTVEKAGAEDKQTFKTVDEIIAN